MKIGCFIIPYFGKLPNYFEVFAKTCAANVDYQWLIFTDDTTEYKVPNNVVLEQMTFEEFKILLAEKFDFEVKLPSYHKICDLKPAFGYIFEEYLKDFRFWGYCDLDTIFGNLNKFITPEILDQYDKLFCLGHCVLFKNNHENNRVFMQPVNGHYWYKESFSSTETTIFDETYGDDKNVNTIFKKAGKKVLEEDWAFNCNIAPANLRRKYYVAKKNIYKVEPYRDAIYVWQSGNIKRYFMNGSKLSEEEFMYMHFQSRHMMVTDNAILAETAFKIMGDGFYRLEVPVTKENFRHIKHKIYSFRKAKLFLNWKAHGLMKRLRLWD